MKISAQLSVIGILSIAAFYSMAANVTQVNRYATVANKPLAAQIDPLLAIQQVHFPQEVQTIGQAVEWWLRFSGFSLVSKEKQPESLQTVMRQALPQIDRNLGPLTVKDGLEVLVGQQSFALIEDPLLRQVNFKLKAGVRNGGKS
ncbi:TPA: hypothetical protein JBD37_12070 [Legionella pneumophila subsp. pneumophila]|uniref:PFGI-1 class ICE element type IV pilus protein PilL2 n=1 Tax=Legionella pneumophila TaxID=446 RepID=UPI0007708083|nr:hypothetical protein [Legionella pneumophila]HAT8853461.1 hypothetical protein [Legionella pneumophila subsp. pneumophila]APF03977.1 hypothetical protein BIZ52_11645 [Legionella pneumophila subsp. fraseri]MCW8438543.1 hypothetical protein [Legionella pneumophila]MCW8480964.1 hypothetical protein [Legionella pneumophila]MCZ4726459.1 hypothetical protein [Legionella pneumophila]